MLYVYDSCAITPKRIYFEWVKEDIIGYTKHGGVAIWGYQFLDINKKIVWECPTDNEDGKKAVRFARKREKFSPAEDRFLYGILWFEDLCKEAGIEFEDYWDRKSFFEEFRQEYLKETGKDILDLGHSKAGIEIAHAGTQAPRRDNPKPSGESDGNGNIERK